MTVEKRVLKSSQTVDNTFAFSGCHDYGDELRRIAETFNRRAARDIADQLIAVLYDGKTHRVRLENDVHTDNGGLKCTATWTVYIETDYPETGAGVVE